MAPDPRKHFAARLFLALLFLFPGVTPGAEFPLGGTSGPAIAVNPSDSLNIAYASLHELRVSTDGGLTWADPVPARYPQGYTHAWFPAQPSLGFDTQGRLFWAYKALVEPVQFPWLRGDRLNILFAQCNGTTGAMLPGYPVDMTELSNAGGGEAHHNSNQSLTIDAPPNAPRQGRGTSPYQDRIYMAWTKDVDLTNTRVFTSFSSDQGMTWSNRTRQNQSPLIERDCYPVDLAVASNGDVFVVYHSNPTSDPQEGGQVMVRRSTDGGVTWPHWSTPPDTAFQPGDAAVSWNLNMPGSFPDVPGIRFPLIGAAQPWILADPTAEGRLYVVANDDPDSLATGDFADVMMATSTDHGATWSAPIRIDSGPDSSLQLMPAAAIDPVEGTIVVHYYDNRSREVNGSEDYLLDVYATVSTDGGVTFAPDFRLNDARIDPTLEPPLHAGAICWTTCGNRFMGIWGSSANDLLVVGEVTGRNSRWDGVSWELETGLTGFYYAVSGRAANDIFAVGGKIMHYDGATWTEQLDPTFNRLVRDVWCDPVGHTIAVGDFGMILRHDGVSWTEETTASDSSLISVWGSAGNDVWAVGRSGRMAHYDGSVWSEVSSGTFETLYGVWGSADDDVWVVGDTGTVLHYDGTSWSSVQGPPHDDILMYTAVHGSDASNVYVVGVGRDRVGRVAKFDGSNWSNVGPVSQELHAVWSDGNDVFVAGLTGSILSSSDGGSTWQEHVDNPGVELGDTKRIFAGHRNAIVVSGNDILAAWGGNRLDGGIPVAQQTVFLADGPVDAPLGAVSASLTVLNAPAPNPFGPTTRLSYSLPAGGSTKLSVYDVQGRHVRTLARGWHLAGRHSAQWDGLDASGIPVAAGVYFIRLESLGEVATRKIVRQR